MSLSTAPLPALQAQAIMQAMHSSLRTSSIMPRAAAGRRTHLYSFSRNSSSSGAIRSPPISSKLLPSSLMCKAYKDERQLQLLPSTFLLPDMSSETSIK
jgi:hypothetical protein